MVYWKIVESYYVILVLLLFKFSCQKVIEIKLSLVLCIWTTDPTRNLINNLRAIYIRQYSALHKKWSFSPMISSINVANSGVTCRFGLIYWRNPLWKTSFLWSGVNNIFKKKYCGNVNLLLFKKMFNFFLFSIKFWNSVQRLELVKVKIQCT